MHCNIKDKNNNNHKKLSVYNNNTQTGRSMQSEMMIMTNRSTHAGDLVEYGQNNPPTWLGIRMNGGQAFQLFYARKAG